MSDTNKHSYRLNRRIIPVLFEIQIQTQTYKDREEEEEKESFLATQGSVIAIRQIEMKSLSLKLLFFVRNCLHRPNKREKISEHTQ